MKERFQLMSPFMQLIVLILIGAVGFIVLSLIMAGVISSGYPNMPIDDLLVQRNQYPIQFMMMYFFPFQAGFLLLPGILFMRWAPKIKNYYSVSSKGVFWSVLLFISIFFLLPFFSEINIWLTDQFGFKEQLINEKLIADEGMERLLGKTSDLSFVIGLLIVGVLTGIAEELAFRRLLFAHMLHYTNQFWLSVITSAFIFALLHFNYLQFLPLLSFGIALALIYQYSGTFWIGAILHAGNNILNLWWLSTDSFPSWMESVDLKTTIPSTLLLMGLLYYQFFRKRSTS